MHFRLQAKEVATLGIIMQILDIIIIPMDGGI